MSGPGVINARRTGMPSSGMGDLLVDDARNKLELIPTVAEADVELAFDPP